MIFYYHDTLVAAYYGKDQFPPSITGLSFKNNAASTLLREEPGLKETAESYLFSKGVSIKRQIQGFISGPSHSLNEASSDSRSAIIIYPSLKGWVASA